MALAQTKETASCLLVMKRPPQGTVAEPQEKAASVAQQTPKLPVPVVPAGGSGALEPPAALAAAVPIQAPVPSPPHALALVDCGPLVRPGALEEAYTTLDQV